MSVDILKKYQALDDRDISKEHERINQLIRANAHPKSFEFPLILQFELTSRCNVFCKHCYNDSGKNDVIDLMTPDKWIDFSKYLVERGGLFECIISGGEPLLLGDKLFEIMDVLHDDGTVFVLITNGFLLDKSKVDLLSKYRYRWLQVSIDGSRASYHDEFRQRTGSWEKAVSGAFFVANAGIPLTIAHSVSPYNLEYIDEMCDLAYSLGASSIMLGEINLSGRTAKNRNLLLNDKQRELYLKKYEENAAKYSGKMLVQRSASPRNSVLRYLNTPNTGMIVRPNGDLRLDCMVPFTIGNVLKDDLEQIWKTKGISCWEHPKVAEFVNHYYSSEYNDLIMNYVDSDILI